MKRIYLILALVAAITANAQVETHSFKFYAEYDGNGNKKDNYLNRTGLIVSIMQTQDFYGNIEIALFGSETRTIAGMPVSSQLVGTGSWLSYVGVNNGWRVFNFANTIIVLINSGATIAKVQRYGPIIGDLYGKTQLYGYTEYRK